MSFKKWATNCINHLNREIGGVDIRVRGIERSSIGVRVEFETGVPVMSELMVSVPVYQERYALVRSIEGERPYSVKGVNGSGFSVSMSVSRDGKNFKPSPRDLVRLEQCRSLRWYRKNAAPDCDFIDATGSEDRFVKLGNVNPEPKKKK